jgi:hypothetical protein
MEEEQTAHIEDTLPKGFILDNWRHCDSRKFVRSFNLVWRKLPVDTQRVIVEHCLKNEDGEGARIIYEADAISLTSGTSGDACAQFDPLGCEFKFLAKFIDLMDEQSIGVLIAHELAHCFLHSTSGGNHGLATCGEAAENEVDQILEREWGYADEVITRSRVANYFARKKLAHL